MFSGAELAKLSPTHPSLVAAAPTQAPGLGTGGHSAAALAAAAAAGFRLGPCGDLSAALPNNLVPHPLSDLGLGLTDYHHQPL